MTENQKLREALQAISHIDDTTNHSVDASAALDRIGQIARQALALPTLDHLPAAGEMVVDHFPDATKMIETAEPVGELPELPEPDSFLFQHDETGNTMFVDAQQVEWGFEKNNPRLHKIGGAFTEGQMRAYARAALSAGDAGWQPIETAPKDGSDCWLLVDGDVRRGFWVEIEFEERRDMDGRYIDQPDADAYWMDHDSGDSLEPTMFYPITNPLPPSLVDIDAAMRKDKT